MMQDEDFEELILRFEKQTLINFIEQLITVLWRRHRLQTIIEVILITLIKYLKGRDSWNEAVNHLQVAHQVMVEVSSSPRRESENDDQKENE